MIARVWHGWTTPANADAYETLLTTMWFESLDDVRAFAGDDYETAYVPEAARAVLDRFDATSAHYEVRERQSP
jgi:hypothetical protein